MTGTQILKESIWFLRFKPSTVSFELTILKKKDLNNFTVLPSNVSLSLIFIVQQLLKKNFAKANYLWTTIKINEIAYIFAN